MELKTIGQHLRARRLDLGLRQWDVAKKLSVNVQTVGNWEVGRDQADFWYMPRVVQFLGYDPRPKTEAKSLREELLTIRLKHRLTQRSLAARLRVNTCTISSWEGGKVQPTPECMARINKIAAVLGSRSLLPLRHVDNGKNRTNPGERHILNIKKFIHQE